MAKNGPVGGLILIVPNWGYDVGGERAGGFAGSVPMVVCATAKRKRKGNTG